MRIAVAMVVLVSACGRERDVDGIEESGIHAPGILDPADPDFHGALLAARDWDFALCQRCHGDDFGGGASGVACTTCHDEGPTACTTCHGDGPVSGAHHAHRVAGALDRAVPCGECHRVPSRWDEPGHILDAAGHADPAPAEVVLGALAARDAVPPRRGSAPVYDAVTGTCQGVYCHGGIFADSAAAHPAPSWSDGAGAAACGGCHGAPPGDHVQAVCERCHPMAFASGRATPSHLDGVVQVGTGCTGCHGDGGPAPPRGLDGAVSPSAIGVGAHQSHLQAPSRLRPPIACEECHQVPDDLAAAGHLDSDVPAEVFPAGAGVLARRDGADPVWDRSTATCRNVYCHGGGVGLAADTAPGRVTTPAWTRVGRAEAACGRCHGLPPRDGSHASTITIRDCATCHPGVDTAGNILFTGPAGAETSEHLDGIVDLR